MVVSATVIKPDEGAGSDVQAAHTKCTSVATQVEQAARPRHWFYAASLKQQVVMLST